MQGKNKILFVAVPFGGLFLGYLAHYKCSEYVSGSVIGRLDYDKAISRFFQGYYQISEGQLLYFLLLERVGVSEITNFEFERKETPN